MPTIPTSNSITLQRALCIYLFCNRHSLFFFFLLIFLFLFLDLLLKLLVSQLESASSHSCLHAY
uniref:Uncharacterized protein n=1 Tax=Rhizophora mucronata TaxID=61149 RepID=A0A2P2IJJ5_RHIMU